MGSIHIDSELLRMYIDVALKNYMPFQEAHLKAYEILSLGNEMLGFLGEHFKIKVTFTIDNEESQLILFGKAYPKDNKPKDDYLQEYNMFNREVLIYLNIVKEFEKIGPQAWHPKCYLVTKDLLLFEDLTLKGFRMFDLRKTQDIEHCLVGLTNLAKFHSATILYEDLKSDPMTKYRMKDNYQDAIGQYVIGYNTFAKVSFRIGLKMAEFSQKYGRNTPHFERVCNRWYDVMKRGVSLMKLPENERSVLSHVDLWNNNMMFKYNDDGKPEDCVFVDYQACQFMSPCADLMSYLYMNLGAELRSNCYDVFTCHYYSELSKMLSERSVRIEDIFTYEKFKRQCVRYKLWGQLHTIIIFQFIFIENDTVMKMIKEPENFKILLNYGRSKLVVETMRNDATFRERILSVIDELIELYIFKNVIY